MKNQFSVKKNITQFYAKLNMWKKKSESGYLNDEHSAASKSNCRPKWKLSFIYGWVHCNISIWSETSEKKEKNKILILKTLNKYFIFCKVKIKCKLIACTKWNWIFRKFSRRWQLVAKSLFELVADSVLIMKLSFMRSTRWPPLLQ